MCDKFIKDNFNFEVYTAYSKINPKLGAMKADFWRYCILYKNGGVYLDAKIKLKKNLDLVIKPEYECILDIPRTDLEIWRTINNEPTYEQWMLFFSKEHIYLKNMIDDMTFDILNNYDPPIYEKSTTSITKQKILHITGPDALARSIKKTINNNDFKIPKHININYNTIALYDNRAKISLYKHNGVVHYSNVVDNIYISN